MNTKVIRDSDIHEAFVNELPFMNMAHTLTGVVEPETIPYGLLDEREVARLRIDSDQNGIRYVVVSQDTPIAWVTRNDWVYKVQQHLGPVAEAHKRLLR